MKLTMDKRYLVVPVSEHYHNGVFQKRNEWMVDHSNRVIAYYNGAPGGTENTIDYALSKGIEVVSNNPDYRPREKKRKQMKSEKMPYPENLLRDIGLEKVFGKPEYTPLNEDQTAGLAHALTTIREREQEMADIKGVMKKIEWGSQIRSYVFQPYTMVKDHRTGYESGNIDDVMNGNLEGFTTSYLKMQ